MRFAIRYSKEHMSIILMQILFICIFIIVFYLYHLPVAAVLYPACICLLIGCLFTGYSIYYAYKRHKKLTQLQYLPANTIQDILIENTKIIEHDYQKIIMNLCREMQAMQDQMANSYEETLDYFTVWVHQIKTPIASMRLHLEAEDSKLSRRLTSDLLHIEQYVEMVLTYLKTESSETDYVFQPVHLDKMIRESIRKLRGDFILKKLNVIYSPSDETVISDEKWLCFVVEQILSNALKYTNTGGVTISVEKPKILCISDTGIGIAPEDIPRIFEKGYTGGNGREYKQASGLGLYLCKQICDRLGHDITVISDLETGTTVKIDLSQYRNLTKM